MATEDYLVVHGADTGKRPLGNNDIQLSECLLVIDIFVTEQSCLVLHYSTEKLLEAGNYGEASIATDSYKVCYHILMVLKDKQFIAYVSINNVCVSTSS